jgi:hypothetical protein
MKILKISGDTTADQRTALHEALAIWEDGGACSSTLMNRLPISRVEILIAPKSAADALAIIVIEGGIVGVHPLDEPAPDTIH